MSLIQELERLISRTGAYQDRELLLRVLEELKKNGRASAWGFVEEKRATRR